MDKSKKEVLNDPFLRSLVTLAKVDISPEVKEGRVSSADNIRLAIEKRDKEKARR